MANNKLAIIGGSGLYDVEEFTNRDFLNLDTPWGKPSDQILKTEVGWCEPVIYTFNSNFEIINFELIPRTTEPSKSYFPEFKLSD